METKSTAEFVPKVFACHLMRKDVQLDLRPVHTRGHPFLWPTKERNYSACIPVAIGLLSSLGKQLTSGVN